MADDVNHPEHYTQHPSGVECITVTEHMGFNLGNAVKYIWRADLKGDAVKDLEKAAWYVQREIARRKGEAPPLTISFTLPTKEENAIEAGLFVSLLANLTANPRWHDEFLDWYKPELRLTPLRAATAFIAGKICSLQTAIAELNDRVNAPRTPDSRAAGARPSAPESRR